MPRCLIAVVIALAGCVSTPAPSPSETDGPIDGKLDSFRDPTDHGALRWNNASRAALTDDEKFHAYSFELSDGADVSLEITASDRNLDTVMYLYRRADRGGSWGRYMERNDNHDGTLQSKIEKSLTAGEYRIIVKGKTSFHRGPFSLLGTCDGAGCMVTSPGGIVVPNETPFTESCVTALEQALASKLVSTDAFYISPAATDGFPREVLIANAHYEGMSDYEDYLDDDDDDFTFSSTFTKLENGSLVRMEDGGDESTVDYAFDADGNLLAYYLHNQSPWAEFFCGLDDEDELDPPHEDCVQAWMAAGPRKDDTFEEGTATWDPDGTDDLDELMHAALEAYRQSFLDGEDALIEIEYKKWDALDDGHAASLLLSSEDGPVVAYKVVATWEEPWVVFESSENAEGPEMRCEQTTI